MLPAINRSRLVHTATRHEYLIILASVEKINSRRNTPTVNNVGALPRRTLQPFGTLLRSLVDSPRGLVIGLFRVPGGRRMLARGQILDLFVIVIQYTSHEVQEENG